MFFQKAILSVGLVLLLSSCSIKKTPSLKVADLSGKKKAVIEPVARHVIKIKKEVRMKDYFHFLDSLVASRDTLDNPNLNEYAIVHANPWIIDSLINSDYYVLKKRGRFLYDQTKFVILYRGDSLIIPDSAATSALIKKSKSTVLDLNIPEYMLRVIQRDDTILSCKVRVGRNAKEYLALAGHAVNLKTPIGEGEIVRIERNPIYVDPDTGKRYDSTQRDDGRYTKLPIIPWIEPSINGVRYGDLIHPTTNERTLGRAYSHGCIGTSEADAWTIYYNAPLGTKVIFRYDLMVIRRGDTIRLKDIYQLKKIQ